MRFFSYTAQTLTLPREAYLVLVWYRKLAGVLRG